MADILSGISTRQTAQTEQADVRQVKNSAGGYAFPIGDWARLHRFLTLGTEGGTYYTSAKALTQENAQVVFRALGNDPMRVINTVLEISQAGRAPRNNPAIFALAVASSLGTEESRAYALANLHKVCRTGTHLFTFAGYVEQFRGWGPALRRAVGNWYSKKDLDKVVYQVLKYRQREGWSHRDLLRLSHPEADSAQRKSLFNWICGRDFGEMGLEGTPLLLEDFLEVQAMSKSQEFINVINRGHGISWEMLPDVALGFPGVWEALVDQGIPQTALMRQLPRLTNLGLASGSTGRKIAAQLQDGERLKAARVHPINVLVALRTYASGAGALGKGTWPPASVFSNALDAAFYNAFGAVEPANKITMLALDISGSMGQRVSGLPITCSEATAALSMVTEAIEPETIIVGFSSGLQKLDLSHRRRLDDNLSYLRQVANWGGTDCSLPMVWAAQNNIKVDTFSVFTDNETWAGKMHPHQALEQYRQKTGINARLVVNAMTATDFSIADPTDPGSLDICGFDSTCPQLLSDFSAGRL